MGSRVFLILLVGIVAAASLAFAVSDLQRREGERRGREQRVADRIVDLAPALSGTPRSLWPVLLGPGPEALRLLDGAAPQAAVADPDLTARLAQRLGDGARVAAFQAQGAACDPHPPAHPPRPGLAPLPPLADLPRPERGPPPPTCRIVGFTLASGERVTVMAPSGPARPRAATAGIGPLYLLVLGVAAAGLALGVARVATAPLRRLSKAALDLGRDLDRPPLAIEGPLEVRQAAQAFNGMQARLKQHLEERTQMLAAITHDLQTPLTRQRLRLEKVADPELRRQLLDDQAAMGELIRDGLDLARASSGAEAYEDLDLDSLLESLAEDAIEAGGEVEVAGRCGCAVATRPQALRRCVSNLLDNALKYAGAAELSAMSEVGAVTIRVLDRGPGIAPAELEGVMRPFVRLETSRSRETGGVGLGLTIARVLAERAGGDLRLSNRPGGGLEARVRLGPPVTI